MSSCWTVCRCIHMYFLIIQVSSFHPVEQQFKQLMLARCQDKTSYLPVSYLDIPFHLQRSRSYYLVPVDGAMKCTNIKYNFLHQMSFSGCLKIRQLHMKISVMYYQNAQYEETSTILFNNGPVNVSILYCIFCIIYI